MLLFQVLLMRLKGLSIYRCHLFSDVISAHTLPEYRKLGLFKITAQEQTYRFHQMNTLQFGFIREGNVAAEKTAVENSATKWPEQVLVSTYMPAGSKL